MSKTERPFSDTQDFVRKIYEESYLGEKPISQNELDTSKPYSIIKNRYFQADFSQSKASGGEIIPLVILPVDVKQALKIPSKNERSNAGLLYTFADILDSNQKYQTFESIGNLYGDNRPKIHFYLRKFYSDIFSIASTQIQKEYSLETLNYSRPYSRLRRETLSSANGSVSLNIAKRLDAGETIDFSKLPIEQKRILISWGYDIPIEKRVTYEEYFSGLKKPGRSNDYYQNILNEIKEVSKIKVLLKKGIAVSLLNIAREDGLYLSGSELHLIINSLETEIPLGTAQETSVDKNGKIIQYNYHFTAYALKKRAMNTLDNDHSLDVFRFHPVKTIGKPVDNLPNTTELAKKGKYERVIPYAEEIAGKKLGNKLNRRNILGDNKDLTFFTYSRDENGGLYYEAEQEIEVGDHLYLRLQELKLI